MEFLPFLPGWKTVTPLISKIYSGKHTRPYLKNNTRVSPQTQTSPYRVVQTGTHQEGLL